MTKPLDAYNKTLNQVARSQGLTNKPDMIARARPFGCATPEVDDRMPVPVARWAAAHALAHVKAGHDAAVPPLSRVARLTGAGIFLVVMLLAVFGVVTEETLTWWVLGAAALMVGAWVLAQQAAGGRTRAAEAEADRITAGWGFPVTQEVAAHLTDRESTLERRIPAGRLGLRPSDRVAIRQPKPRA